MPAPRLLRERVCKTQASNQTTLITYQPLRMHQKGTPILNNKILSQAMLALKIISKSTAETPLTKSSLTKGGQRHTIRSNYSNSLGSCTTIAYLFQRRFLKALHVSRRREDRTKFIQCTSAATVCRQRLVKQRSTKVDATT